MTAEMAQNAQGQAAQKEWTGCYDVIGRKLYLGDTVVLVNDGPHTKPEYWNLVYKIIFNAPSYTLKHIGCGKDCGAYAFALRNRRLRALTKDGEDG